MKQPITTITLAALSLLASAPIEAAILYSFSAPNGAYNYLNSIETGGAVSSLFALGDGSVSYNGGLAYRPTDSTFFAIGNDFAGNSSFVSFTSSGSGSLTSLASLGTGFLGGLAFNSADQRFYAIASDFAGNSSLYSFADDGVLSAPQPLGAGFYGSLTYNAGDGLLYAIGAGQGGVQNGLYSIDPLGVGPTTLLFSLGGGSTDYGAGLAWDPDNSQFYTLGFDGFNPFSLATFSLAGSNTLAPVASLPPTFFRGLVLLAEDGGGGNGGGGNGGGGDNGLNPIPEPSTYAMLGAGLAALALLRRNRRIRSARHAPLALLAAALILPAAANAQFSQPVRDVENPAQNAFITSGSISVPSGNTVGTPRFLDPIPTGKRLTVESLGLACRASLGVTAVSATLEVQMRNSPNSTLLLGIFPLTVVRQGTQTTSGASVSWGGTLNGRIFHDNPAGNTNIILAVYRYPTGESLNCTYALTGGLTNLPLQ